MFFNYIKKVRITSGILKPRFTARTEAFWWAENPQNNEAHKELNGDLSRYWYYLGRKADVTYDIRSLAKNHWSLM
jgi:hypothetical protein